MQRQAAIAAEIPRRGLDAQPVTARGTFRIQALNRPTGQILHSDSSQETEWTRAITLLEEAAQGRRAGNRRREGLVRTAKRGTVKEQLSRKTGGIVRRVT